jgi:serine/threonine protein kinase
MSGNSPEKRKPETTASSRETVPPGAAPPPASRETILPGQADSVAESSQASGSGIPQEFGRYRVEECLGQGAMGAVYKAHDTQLDRPVALKVPKFDVSDSALLERFYREARSAATLSHPNICPVHDVGELGGIHYISMGYLEGKPLSAFVRPDKPLTEKQAVMIIRKLAVALSEAHGKGIIHRDLKPDNVMIDLKSNPVIMDFGLARRSAGADDIRVTQGGQMLGTPAYMSPEQAEGDVNQMGPRCDIYSLGVILYELLTGRLPYEGSIASVLAQIMKGEPRPPAQLRRDLNPELQALCLKMMAADQEARHASMAEVARDLAAFVKGKPTSVRDAAPAVAPAGQPAPTPQAAFGAGEAGLSQLIAVDDAPVSARASRKSRVKNPTTASARPSKNSPPPWAIWSGAAAGALLILLAGYVLFVRVGDQTVRIEIDDPKAQVFVDGDKVQIKNLGATIELKPGKHGVEIRRGDIVVKADSFTVLDGNNPVLQLEVLKKAPNGNGEPVEVSPTQPSNPVAAISKPTNPLPLAKPERPAITEIPEEFAQSTDPQKLALGFLLSRGVLVQLVYEKDGKFLKSKMVQNFEDVEDGQFEIRQVSISKKNRIEGDDWSFVKSLPDLGTAHFSSCPGLNDEGLAHLAGHPSIGLLQIDVGNLTDAGLAVLQTLPNLNTLHLVRDSNDPIAHRITDAAIEHLVRIPRLRILNATDSDVSDAGLAQLSAASPPELRDLNLSGSKVTDQGGVHIRKLTQLRVLTLNNTSVGDGLASALGDLTELTNLNLTSTKIGDSVLQAIAGHQKLSRLQLTGTRISDAGIAHLQKLPALTQLTLNSTQITDDCLTSLGQIKSLKKVSLYECSVTSQAVQQLQKTRPTLKIDGSFK